MHENAVLEALREYLGGRDMILQRHADAYAAAHALAAQIIEALRDGLQQRGAGSLAVPGGRTPLPLFLALRNAELDWSRVAITLTDERWVPESDPGSNAALVRRELLRHRAAAASFHSMYDGHQDAGSAAAGVWNALQAMPRPFDAVVLGMGEDGHFASLFPGNASLESALEPHASPGCVAMRAPVAPHERISLNLAALLQTRRLFLFVTGEAKRNLLLQAARGGERRCWPVSALLAQRHPMPEVFWSP